MNVVRSGKTNLYVSRIGMEGIPIQRPSPDQATWIIHHALDSGITFFDTANGYLADGIAAYERIAAHR
jgi:aryl-alcohol dehydrogenase-like predicted oxidoreductase